jgi:hypothetical protein
MRVNFVDRLAVTNMYRLPSSSSEMISISADWYQCRLPTYQLNIILMWVRASSCFSWIEFDVFCEIKYVGVCFIFYLHVKWHPQLHVDVRVLIKNRLAEIDQHHLPTSSSSENGRHQWLPAYSALFSCGLGIVERTAAAAFNTLKDFVERCNHRFLW